MAACDCSSPVQQPCADCEGETQKLTIVPFVAGMSLNGPPGDAPRDIRPACQQIGAERECNCDGARYQ